MYTSTVYNIMIASPNDVGEERKITREKIWDWNNINSLSRNIVLLPVSWEFNSVPSMGERPQEIINKQVLNSADLLVGIFWTRIGTPTGKALSGSVEEIEKHINSGKPAMLYFSNKPVIPGSIDLLQYEAVQNLRKEYQRKGLTDTFDSLEHFEAKFQRHLAMKLNFDDYFKGFELDKTREKDTINPIKDDSSIMLSDEAKVLLLEASKDMNGQLFQLDFIGGYEIQTNSKQFVTPNDPRSKALWASALTELESNQWISSLSAKREIFEVTNKGYQIAEVLK